MPWERQSQEDYNDVDGNDAKIMAIPQQSQEAYNDDNDAMNIVQWSQEAYNDGNDAMSTVQWFQEACMQWWPWCHEHGTATAMVATTWASALSMVKHRSGYSMPDQCDEGGLDLIRDRFWRQYCLW